MKKKMWFDIICSILDYPICDESYFTRKIQNMDGYCIDILLD